jgi:gentisate 1,2-dioxygenase
MRYGDFIITPSWTFHDHGNEGSDPVVWLDGLDIPLVRFLDAGFAEKSAVKSQVHARPEGDALLRYGSNMLPLDHAPTAAEPSRVFVYPYARTRESLVGLSRGGADPHFGIKMRFVNPATGRSPMPTIGTFAQRLVQGVTTRPYRSSDSTVYVCLEGAGRATIEGTEGAQAFDFSARDVFVVPSWNASTLAAGEDTILFSFSDRPVQEVLGLWREEKMQ